MPKSQWIHQTNSNVLRIQSPWKKSLLDLRSIWEDNTNRLLEGEWNVGLQKRRQRINLFITASAWRFHEETVGTIIWGNHQHLQQSSVKVFQPLSKYFHFHLSKGFALYTVYYPISANLGSLTWKPSVLVLIDGFMQPHKQAITCLFAHQHIPIICPEHRQFLSVY